MASKRRICLKIEKKIFSGMSYKLKKLLRSQFVHGEHRKSHLKTH